MGCKCVCLGSGVRGWVGNQNGQKKWLLGVNRGSLELTFTAQKTSWQEIKDSEGGAL